MPIEPHRHEQPSTVERVDSDGVAVAVQFSDLAAHVRAIEARQPDPYLNDDLAHLFTSDWTARQLADALLVRAPIEQVVVRGRFGQHVLDGALAAGVRQVVGLGIGSDTRVWRTRVPPGTRYFEVDLPGRLVGKDKLLADAGVLPSFEYQVVEADLLTDWASRLVAAGFDPLAATCWIIEGISWFLLPDQLEMVTAEVTGLSAAGSWLTMDVVDRAWHTDAGLAGFRDRMTSFGTPVVAGMADPAGWLDEFGWAAEAYRYRDLAEGRCSWLETPPARLNRDVPLWVVRATATC
jgi:methyltransferase (TIGR00027 family)